MIDDSPEGVAKRLAEAIRTSGVKKAHLAEAAGVSPQAIAGWLRTGKIARHRIPAVTKVLKRSAQWLLDGEDIDPDAIDPEALRLAEAIQSLPPESRAHLQAVADSFAKSRPLMEGEERRKAKSG